MTGVSVAPLFYDTGHDGVPGGWIEMVRHNFRSLGPLVQADRMVREYVTTLYAPAAESSRALAADNSTRVKKKKKKNAPAAESSRALAADSFHAGRDLAAWTQRVREAWPSVRIEHVEADGAEPSLGAVLEVRVTAALGPLSPSDVSVEVVYGAPGEDDEIVDPLYVTLHADAPAVQDGAPGQHARFSGAVELGRPGPFGYTVRVLPNHPLLASRAELGLVTYPDAPAGMTNGDLR